MTKKLNQEVMDLRQSGIRSVTMRCNELGGVNLGQGVCDLPMAEEIKTAAYQAIAGNKNIYSDYRGVASLREVLAEKIKNFNKVLVNPETEIAITHGATGAYVAALKTLFSPGDEIILFEPFYGYHLHVAKLFSINIKTVSIHIDDLSFDLNDLRKVISKNTKAIILCTPNNPTGKVFTKQELLEIGKLAEEHDFYIITDEMYEHFIYPGHEHISIASLNNFKARTLTISGFSKTYNMTGWRLGYVFGPAKLIEKIALVHDFFYVCPVTPLQYAGIQALQMPASYYEALQRSFLQKRDLMVQGLRYLGFTCTEPQGAYYMLVDGSNLSFDSGEDLSSYLLERAKVAAVPGSAFYLTAEQGAKKLRFCFALNSECLEKAINQLQQVLKAN